MRCNTLWASPEDLGSFCFERMPPALRGPTKNSTTPRGPAHRDRRR